MSTFTVTTWEHVEGVYYVEAATEAEARAKFTARPGRIEWDEGVEQHSYEAFDVEVRGVTTG